MLLASLLLTLNIFHTCSSVSVVNFEHVNAGWVKLNDWKSFEQHLNNKKFYLFKPDLK